MNLVKASVGFYLQFRENGPEMKLFTVVSSLTAQLQFELLVQQIFELIILIR